MSDPKIRQSSEPASQTRTTKDGPWCWQSKDARCVIRVAFDASNNVASALGVYDALTEIASDEQAETFETTHAWVQGKSGVSVSTIKKHLSRFAELGLLSITPRHNAASIYSLLPVGNGWLANGGQSGPLATSEESKKNLRRKKKKIMSTLVAAPTVQPVVVPSDSVLSELKAEAEANGNEVEFEKWITLNKRKGWRQANKTKGALEPIKHPRQSLAAFIQHISAANQCSKDKTRQDRAAPTASDHAKGF